MEEITKKGQKNILAIISYIGILCLIPILMKDKDGFVKFHAKQGLVLFIAEMIAWVIFYVLPYQLWFLYNLLTLFLIILSIIGIINAVKGEQKLLPIIGKFAEKFKF